MARRSRIELIQCKLVKDSNTGLSQKLARSALLSLSRNSLTHLSNSIQSTITNQGEEKEANSQVGGKVGSEEEKGECIANDNWEGVVVTPFVSSPTKPCRLAVLLLSYRDYLDYLPRSEMCFTSTLS